MTLKELVARNLSTGMREIANAEMAAKHSKEGTIPNGVVHSLQSIRMTLETLSDMLAQTKETGQELH